MRDWLTGLGYLPHREDPEGRTEVLADWQFHELRRLLKIRRMTTFRCIFRCEKA